MNDDTIPSGFRRTREWRCTRPRLYAMPGCPGHSNPKARQGYYVQADTEEEARAEMAQDFPGEPIDITLCDFVTIPE